MCCDTVCLEDWSDMRDALPVNTESEVVRGDPGGALVPLPATPEPARAIPDMPFATYQYLTRLA